MVHLKVPSSFHGPYNEPNQQSSSNNKKDCLIQIMLYRPPPNDPFINRAVAWIDGPFSHVEVGFDDGMASSIYAGEQVFMHQRTFSNPNYTIISIPITGEQERKARQFCIDHSLKNINFDGLGMYTARLPGVLRGLIRSFGNSGNKTFCSKYVVQMMQHIGVDCFMGIEPSTVSPSMVHRILQENLEESGENAVLATTPYRRNLLSTMAVV